MCENCKVKSMTNELKQVFSDLSINGEIIDKIVGPAVTRYHVKIPAGSTLKKYTARAEDIALSLGVKNVAIAPVVGTPLLLGMDVPNPEQETVSLNKVLISDIASETEKTAFGLGKNLYGKIIMPDLVKMPHLLISGTTGSGKSVCINAIIYSLIKRNTANELQFVMIDPKMVELSGYNGIPHLIMPVVTDMREAMNALEIVVKIMNDRYETLMATKNRNIEAYNSNNPEDKMSRIVVVIDEMADLMITNGKEVEEYIIRIAQKARACGIHLIVATQRPERVIITGLIKANIPSRIAFMVRAKVDSRIILDEDGAENLLGRGDMLFYPVGQSAPERIQGCWIDDDLIQELVESLQNSSNKNFVPKLFKQEPVKPPLKKYDALLPYVAELIFKMNIISENVIKRRFALGHTRMSKILDQLAELKVISYFPRELNITKEEWGVIQRDNGITPADINFEILRMSNANDDYANKLFRDMTRKLQLNAVFNLLITRKLKCEDKLFPSNDGKSFALRVKFTKLHEIEDSIQKDEDFSSLDGSFHFTKKMEFDFLKHEEYSKYNNVNAGSFGYALAIAEYWKFVENKIQEKGWLS